MLILAFEVNLAALSCEVAIFCGEKWFHEFFCTFSRFYERAVTLVDDDSFLWLLFIKINAWTGMQIWSFHLMFQRKSRLTPTARADLLKCSREIFHNDATKKGLVVTKLKFAKEWNSYPTATEQEHCHRDWSGKKVTRTSARKWNFSPVFWHSFGLVTS